MSTFTCGYCSEEFNSSLSAGRPCNELQLRQRFDAHQQSCNQRLGRGVCGYNTTQRCWQQDMSVPLIFRQPGLTGTIASLLNETERVKARQRYMIAVQRDRDAGGQGISPTLDPDYQHPPCDVTFFVEEASAGGSGDDERYMDWSVTFHVKNPLTTTVGDLNKLIKNEAPLTTRAVYRPKLFRRLYPDERTVHIKSDHTVMTMSSDGHHALWETIRSNRVAELDIAIADLTNLWVDPTKISLELGVGRVSGGPTCN